MNLKAIKAPPSVRAPIGTTREICEAILALKPGQALHVNGSRQRASQLILPLSVASGRDFRTYTGEDGKQYVTPKN